MLSRSQRFSVGCALAMACALLAHASLAQDATAAASAPEVQVQITGAWVRPAVMGQGGTGGFMTLISPRPARLVAVSSPVAAVSQLHQMSLDGNVMRIDKIPAIKLPAGQPVALKAGGMHFMLMNLKRPLTAGEKVPLILYFKDEAGQPFQQALQAPVQMSAARAGY